jgi:outer membrane receptor protein involved in Fe transport
MGTAARPRFASVLLRSTALAGLFAVCASDMTFAAESAVETVVVSAQRRDEDILTVPYNISAVSGDRIDQLRIIDNAELLRSVPGVNVVDRGERSGGVINTIRIRGLSVDSSALGDYAVTAASTVATYVDETPIFANFRLKDIERVEVLKGPQGTLYGSGALGGAVRYIMRKPSTEGFEGSITVTGSQTERSDGTGFSADGVINIPLSNEFAFRASGSFYDYPGSTDYVNVYKLDENGVPVYPDTIFDNTAVYKNIKDADWYRGWYGRAALMWKPSERFDMTLSYMYESDRYGGRRGSTIGEDGFGNPYERNEIGSVIREPGDREIWLSALEANLDLGFATLSSNTSYYRQTGHITSDNTGYYAQLNLWQNYYYAYPRPAGPAIRTYGDKAFVEEVRLVSKPGGSWDYVIGGFYRNQIQYATHVAYLLGFKNWFDACAAAGPAVCGKDVFGGFFPVESDLDYVFVSDQRYTEVAGYGELTYHINDDLQVTGGIRVFHDTSTVDVLQQLGVHPDFFFFQTSLGRTSDTKVLFKANASWNFAERGMVYATFSQGYRRGGSNGTPTGGIFAEDPRYQSYDPDRVDNYELGVKGAFDNWVYNIDVFYVDWHDIQLNGASPRGFYVVTNGESGISRGIEAQVDYYGENWHFGLGYTYTDAKLGADLWDATHSFVYNFEGARLPGVPEHVLNGMIDYTIPFDNGASLFLHVDGYYQSSALNTVIRKDIFLNVVDFPGEPRFYANLKGFALFNASATYSMNNWSATLWAKNVFDDPAVMGVYTQAYMGPSPHQNYFGNASKQINGISRTLGVTLGYTF